MANYDNLEKNPQTNHVRTDLTGSKEAAINLHKFVQTISYNNISCNEKWSKLAIQADQRLLWGIKSGTWLTCGDRKITKRVHVKSVDQKMLKYLG